MGASISGIKSLASVHFSPAPEACSSDRVQAVVDLLSTKLPPELSLYIVDLAEYWTVQTFDSKRPCLVTAGPRGELRSLNAVTAPIKQIQGGTLKPLRRISITTTSQDQGWSDQRQFHGTREGSSSFFEVALVRPSQSTPPASSLSSASSSSLDTTRSPSPTSPTSSTTTPDRASSASPTAQTYRIIPHTRTRLHSNIHASRTASEFTSVLLQGESAVVDEAQPGDRVIVFASAQYPGWVNKVDKCSIRLEVMPL